MEREIAKGLLSIGAVFLRPEQPFTWASGIKSPIYCDNRLILTAPEVRKKVEAAIAETVKAKFPACEGADGNIDAGIAHAAIAATILDLPMGYVRSGSKDHGRGNQIEANSKRARKSWYRRLDFDGGIVHRSGRGVACGGCEVLGVVSIFTYGMKKGWCGLLQPT